jgi:predicted PurR-regulated permease PerM
VRGARLIVIAAAVVVVLAGLRAAQAFVVPLLMAVFLTVLCAPPLRALRRRGLPEWLAVALVVSGAALIVLAVAVVLGGTVQRFLGALPEYRAKLDGMVQGVLSYLEGQGISLSAEQLSGQMNVGAVFDLAGLTAGSLVAAFSNVVLVLLLMAFFLFEVSRGPRLIRRAMRDPHADLSALARGADDVQRYLAIKTVLSLANAAVAIGVCVAFDVDFALVWGLLAFLFNYVPNIGSILAGIPPILVALVQHGPARAATIAGIFLLVDMVSGHIVEPKVMGSRLGLSPMVVMVSLVFWGWMWGPVGTLLSVPLTSMAKIMFEQTQDLRWLAVLLGPDDPDPR